MFTRKAIPNDYMGGGGGGGGGEWSHKATLDRFRSRTRT
jgi:hypothetical protein